MHNEIDLLAFALMPNHIHLQIKQKKSDSIAKFMKRLTTSYVMYFNRKYKRVGALFQNIYKAALINDESYLLHLSRYIHLNPINTNHLTIDFSDFCSLPYYTGNKEASWVKKDEILGYFKSYKANNKGKTYIEFVNTYKIAPEAILGDLTIDEA
jgi:putative transposase